MDCNEIAKAQALANPKMEFLWNTVVDEFAGEEHLQSVILKNLKTNELLSVKVDSCFLFIGYLPNTDIFKDMLDMNRGGYLITNEKMETNIEGVFAAGDVRDKFLKQVATAVGDGAIAGYSVEKYLAESEIFHQQIMQSEMPGIVYLWNAIDPKCRELLPLIEKYEKEYDGKIKVTKIDIYKSAGLANRLGISQVPSIVTIKDGKIDKVISENICEDELAASLR